MSFVVAKDEVSVFSEETIQWCGDSCEVCDKVSENPNCTEEMSNVALRFQVSPVVDGGDSRVVNDATFGTAAVTEDVSFKNCDDSFLGGESAADGADALEEPVDDLEVLPDIYTDTIILRDCRI